MDIINSLLTSVFGMTVVFAVLVSLIGLIYAQSALMTVIHKQQTKKPSVPATTAAEPVPVHVAPAQGTPRTRPELKLYDVDERTAAMAMAIICAESDVPANELIFKSIRLIGE